MRIKNYIKTLDRLEASPLQIAEQHWNKANHILQKAKRSHFVSKQNRLNLEHRVIALGYRLGKIPHAECAMGVEFAAKWKAAQFVSKGQPLTAADLKQLQTLSYYPRLAAHLHKNSGCLNEFFKWSITNHLPVEVFAAFPGVVHRIDKALLKSRIGAFGGLKCAAGDVTLLIENKPVSILDPERQVTLSNGLVLKVAEIFKVFQKKNYEEGFLTYLPKGVTNWDPHQLGPYNPSRRKVDSIDLSQPRWYEQLMMQARLTSEEATRKFGLPCDGKNWVLTVAATRQTPGLHPAGSHGFLRLAIPRGDGTYDYTYGFGKYAKKYFKSSLEAAFTLASTVQGTIEYPDNNEAYTHREKKEKHFLMTPERGQACLESMRQDLLQVRQNNFAFNPLIKNCTDWVVSKIRKFVSPAEAHIYNTTFFHLQIGHPSFMRKMGKAPKVIRHLFFSIVFVFLGGHKKMILKRPDGSKRTVSVFKTIPWSKERPFRHPGVLFR